MNFKVQLDLTLREVMAPSGTPTGRLHLWGTPHSPCTSRRCSLLLLPAAFLHSQVYVPSSTGRTFSMYSMLPSVDTSSRPPGWAERGLPARKGDTSLPQVASRTRSWTRSSIKHFLLRGDQYPSGGSTHM